MTTDVTQEASPQIDVLALKRLLDGPSAQVRDQVREILSEPGFAPVLGLATPEYREQVLTWARELAHRRGAAIGYPRQYGGEGDTAGFIAAFETLAHGDLSLLVKVGVQFGLWGGAILHLGSLKHHEAYLGDIASLDLPGCFAMTESGHGSDVQSLRTTATYDAGAQEFVLDTPDLGARKDYIGNAAAHGRMAAVFAQLIVAGESHGVHAFVVPLRDDKGKVLSGVTIEDCGEKLGLNGVDNGRIRFDKVRIPRDALLDRFARVTPEGSYESAIDNPDRRFFTMLGTLVQGRVSVAGGAISAAKSALTIAIRYGLQRRQFGPPGGGEEALLLDYRMHQRRLLPLLARTYALHFAQQNLVAQLHAVFSGPDASERDRRVLETQAAGLKALATWHATETIQTCREACGGAGYLAENRFAALKADTDVFTTFEGDNTVLMQLVAKSLITDYRDQFGELDPIGMVRFAAEQALETVVEKTLLRQVVETLQDVVPSREDEDAMRNGDYHLELFRWREEHLLSGLARRLKKGIDRGIDPFEVFNAVQDHVVHAARTHIDRVVLEAFLEAVGRAEDDSLAAGLDRVVDLYALSNIEADRGWFLEHARMTSARSKAVTKLVNDLCLEVRDDAAALVDAFAIPAQWIDVPLLHQGD